MATVGHIAAALLTARLYHGRRPRLAEGLGWCALSFLPDADVGMFALVDYSHPLGHRGAAHSLAFAAAIGLLAALAAATTGGREAFSRRLPRPPPGRLLVAVLAVVASHGLLDCLTDGGLGIALLWPFDDTRYFAPWRPIPVAPIGPGMFGERGLYVVAVESLVFSPLVVLSLAPLRARRS